jgi:hypothetical protein
MLLRRGSFADWSAELLRQVSLAFSLADSKTLSSFLTLVLGLIDGESIPCLERLHLPNAKTVS